MAKRKRKSGEESVSGYFRKVFEERPEWLIEKSNDAILARYRVDHQLAPDAELAKNIRQSLSNLKSILRHKDRHQAKKRGRPPGRPAAINAATNAAPTMSRSSNHRLEKLEEAIDDCLTMAKHEDRQEFHIVIQLLRRARNEVVWKLGQSDK